MRDRLDIFGAGSGGVFAGYFLTGFYSILLLRLNAEPFSLAFPIQRQCALIGLPRSSYYRERNAEQERPENLEIMKLIDSEYTKHPFY
ncbi:MAG: hypothetical protein KAH06_08500, partial [Desulfobacterales bacterium]|nr:hypothetical protein [Desulfobacterales bacterium]